MGTRWQDHVSDPQEIQVFQALSNPKWDLRTVQGISEDTGIRADRVREILGKYEGSLVRKSAVPDKHGRELYALERDRSKVGEMLDLITIFASKTLK